MIELSVNVNKIALVRNSRGASEPDVLELARVAIEHGAYGITVHPRPDLRHVRPDDVVSLGKMLRKDFPGIEFNLEGNPFAPANDRGYPGYLALVEETLPDQCTLVPDSDTQLTSDHGFDIANDEAKLRPIITKLKKLGTRVSLFMDAVAEAGHELAFDPLKNIALAKTLGVDRIELYTGPFAAAISRGDDVTQALAPYVMAARAAHANGIGVNAGHDLSLANLAIFAQVPNLLEVSIGHALITDALHIGMATAVSRYVSILRTATLRRRN